MPFAFLYDSNLYFVLYLIVKSVKVLCAFAFASYFAHLSASYSVWPFTFTKKSDCDIKLISKTNRVLSVTSIIMLVKVLHILHHIMSCMPRFNETLS